MRRERQAMRENALALMTAQVECDLRYILRTVVVVVYTEYHRPIASIKVVTGFVGCMAFVGVSRMAEAG